MPTPFRLTRWFGILCLASLAFTAVVSATLLSRFLAERMLHRTGEVTMEFVHSLIRIHDGARFFEPVPPGQGEQAARARLDEIDRIFGQVARMPDVIHANLYDRDRLVIWSTNPEAIGRKLAFNPELAEALDGELVIESDILNTVNYIKPEHVFLTGRVEHAVENYIPVQDPGGAVLGVVELYMSPQSLFEDILSLTRVIWIGALATAALLFAVLVGIALRADALIRNQQRELVDAKSMAAVGEMASAVAHGIRNPLASIRSSAELMIEDNGLAADMAPDIVRQVDRLEGWVRRLLSYAYQKRGSVEPVPLNDVVRAVAGAVERDLQRGNIALVLSLGEVPDVPADRDAIEHALTNLVSNAIEAMPGGGQLSLSTATGADGRSVRIVVADTGTGMAPERMEKIFQPFQTSKAAGLGVGLAMVKRSVEALGGSIDATSRVGAGATFTLILPLPRR